LPAARRSWRRKIRRGTQYPSSIAFAIAEKDLFPEGITYDPKTEQFFVSSISKAKIVAIDKAGKKTDFIQPKQDGMLLSLGMKVDCRNRRLWAVSNSDWGENIVSGIHIYDIDSKKLIQKFFTARNSYPAYNDLVLMKDGSAYITDWKGNGIYRVLADLSRVELFLRSDDLLAAPNGISASPDEAFLYVALDARGIVLVDLKSREVKPLTNRLAVDMKGIDGLMLYKNSLIGILNGKIDKSEHCIARYQLSANGREIIAAAILDKNNPLFDMPTTGVIVNDELYCLAATFVNLLKDDGSFNIDDLKDPVVLRYKL
jgi:DNA-binding beta-propeller fold protein YncE